MRTPIQIRCRQCKKLRDPEFFHDQNLCECCEGTCPVCEDEGIYREDEFDAPSRKLSSNQTGV